MSTGKITITFLSDWHVGEGAGGVGHIDRLVRRDPQDGLPFVPAKTLTGILRDACERVAGALDEDDPAQAWSRFCDRLFGRESKGTQDPRRAATTTSAAIRFGPARYGAALRQALGDDRHLALRSALTFIKPGVKIDSVTGMAEGGMLRLEEVALAGSELQAEWTLDAALSEPQQKAAAALLAAGCRVVERLGAKRRRGAGRCRLEVAGTPSDWLQRLQDVPPEWVESPSVPPELVAGASGSGRFQCIALDLALLSPVVVPDRTLGNVVSGRDHIPGTLLLPALDAALRRALGDHGEALTTLLASGRIQIRNAYPARGDLRLLPVPLAFEAEKEVPSKLRNGFFKRPETAVQFKPLRAGYVPETFVPALDGLRSPVQSAQTIALTHATIDDRVQRPTTDVGGVYTYEALVPGQAFRAELWIEDGLVGSLDALCRALPGEVRIGRAKKDDYGRVALRATPAAAPHGEQSGSRGNLTLWLVSPLLARDARLVPVCDADRLARWLESQAPDGTAVAVVEDRCRAFREEGWMNAWGEPRPSRMGLAAGSCVKLHFNPPLPGNVLARWQAAGLGERRGEGYGEVRIDPGLLAGEHPPREALPASVKGSCGGDVPVTEFTRQLHRNAWRILIRAHVLTHADAIARSMGWTAGKPGNSQIGALRSQFEGWSGDSDRERFRTWWTHLTETANRAEGWPAECRDKSRNPIGRFGEGPDAVWVALAESGLRAEDLPCLPGHRRDEMKTAMAAEATRIYWLGVIGATLDQRAKPAIQTAEQHAEVRHGA